MLSDQFISELGIALQAQNHSLKEVETAISEIDISLKESATKISRVSSLSNEIAELEAILEQLEADVDWIEEEDFGDFDADELLSLYNNRQQSVFRELRQIGFKDWNSFVRDCQIYALSEGFDPLAPYDSFLAEADLKQIQSESESFKAQYKWDKWDYIFVGASGVLASLTDYFLVRIPQSVITGDFAGQAGSPITEWLKKYDVTKSNDWFAQWAQYLSQICKVPYDAVSYAGESGVERIAGMNPKTHRFQSLGHDPVLGFIFGVLDIMRGTITGFSYDNLTHKHNWLQGAVWSDIEPVGLIEAILRQFGHLISDVATPMGLPAPFMTLIQGINIGSFGEKGRTVGEVARWMYLNGYDFRHFLVSGITPAVIEIFLRLYIMLRHYSEHGDVKFELASHPKYRSMLLMAHGIATLGNVGKIALMQGNPLAINYAEWLAFIRYLAPSVKYWIFDQHRLYIEHLERINDDRWNDLLQSSDQLLATVTKAETSKITLGKY